jgi:hypothetical protein
LFGGRTISGVTNAIYRAPTTNPLSWTITGSTLPAARCGGHLALINNSFYLLGGADTQLSATNTIYQAPLTTPTTFSLVGTLPVSCYWGQFFTYGNFGFIIAPIDDINQEPLTTILRCNVATPTTWTNFSNIRGQAIQSQLAIIYDRIFLFGGNGSTLIFTHDQILKYSIAPNSLSQIYGNITRTQYQNTVNQLDLIKVIGFPFWRTDYQE